MRVATFNVNFPGAVRAKRLGGLVARHGVDLLLLQEANPSSLPQLVHAAGLDWVISSYDAGAPRPSSRGRARVAAIAGRGSPPSKAGYLPDVALPERIVFAHIDSPIGHVQVASYHAPPGVTWGRVKVDHAHALLDWINQATDPVVVGADANTPKIDHPDRDQVLTHWATGSPRLRGQIGDDVVFGGHPVHDLDDAFRRWLEDHPGELATIMRQRPSGPLAVSHVTGKRHDRPGTPRRFDTIWISRSLTVTTMTYDYTGAIAAGSDHALLTADLHAELGKGPHDTAAALALLAEAEGISKQETTVRAIREAAARRVREDEVRELSATARERYAELLDRLGQ